MTAQTDTPNLTTYHFILTVQRSGGLSSTRSDVLHLPDGTTRQEALTFLKNQLFPHENLTILFFALEPNQL